MGQPYVKKWPLKFHEAWVVPETHTASLRKSNRASFSRSNGRQCRGSPTPIEHQMNSVTVFERASGWSKCIFKHSNCTPEDGICTLWHIHGNWNQVEGTEDPQPSSDIFLILIFTENTDMNNWKAGSKTACVRETGNILRLLGACTEMFPGRDSPLFCFTGAWDTIVF